MNHFLRLLCIGSGLFVLLALFGHSQDLPDSDHLSVDGLEQLLSVSGIPAPYQELPAPVFVSLESPLPPKALTDPAKSREHFHSLLSKQQLVQSERDYRQIKFDLLQRTGVCLQSSSRKEMGS